MNKLKRKGLSGRLSALALSLSMVAVLPSCGPADQEQFTRTGKVMVIGKANPDDVSFWADVRNGALDAGEELSYEVTFQSAENDNDVDMQKGFINDAIRDNYDVIVIAPNSLTELNEDLDKATAKGIKIININSACEYDKVSCLIASSDGAAASTAVGAAVDIIRNSSNGKLAGAGRIGIVGHTASTADARITVFKNALTNQILNDMQSNSTEAEYIDAPNGERLPTPNTAAQLAVQAASKAGVHSEEITSRAMQAAQEAAAALTEAGVPGYDDWNGSGASGGGADGELITPEEASEKAREAATAAGAPQQAIEAAAQKAYEEAAAAIEKAKAEGKDVPESGGSSDDDEDEVDVSDLITPEEAAEKARESATAAGAPPQAIEAAAQQAYDDAAAAIEKAKAGGGSSEGGSSEGGAPAEGGAPEVPNNAYVTASTFPEVQASYFVESERCTSSFEAFEAALNMLDPDNDGVADDTGIRLMYATNTNTTIGVCQAIEQLDLTDEVNVIGFNSDERELSYIKTGVLDASIVQNPYSMGYLGVTYAKKLVDGNTITKNINTGVTLLTADNINDDYIQILLYPDQSISISEDDKKDKKSENSESSDAEAGSEENGGNE